MRLQFAGFISSIRLLACLPLLAYTIGASAEERTIEDCVIEPHKIAEVSSSVDGVVDKVVVKRGKGVKGEVWLEVEDQMKIGPQSSKGGEK